MAEAPAWRARFLQRVESAHEHLRDLNERLVTLEAFFLFPLSEVGTKPSPEAEMAALRVKLDLLMGSLRSAEHILNSAIVHMQEAIILAVHGGNTANPWVPFTSIQSFGPHDAALKAAMGSLETSHDLTTLSACKLVEWSHDHLSMVIALVGSPGIPDGMAFAKLEYDTAHTVLPDVIQRTQAALADATIALQASQAWMEWVMKKRKAFDKRGDMAVAAWAEQQQRELTLRARRLSRSKVDPEEERRLIAKERKISMEFYNTTLKRHTLVLRKRDLMRKREEEDKNNEISRLLAAEGLELDTDEDDNKTFLK